LIKPVTESAKIADAGLVLHSYESAFTIAQLRCGPQVFCTSLDRTQLHLRPASWKPLEKRFIVEYGVRRQRAALIKGGEFQPQRRCVFKPLRFLERDRPGKAPIGRCLNGGL